MQTSEEIRNILPIPCENKGMSKPIWNLQKDGLFIVASVNEALHTDSNISPLGFNHTHFSNMWKVSIPKKCKFFIWSIIHGGINTIYGSTSKGGARALASILTGAISVNQTMKRLIFSLLDTVHLPSFGITFPDLQIMCSQVMILKPCALNFAS